MSDLLETDFKPEASICNYYPSGVGTIGIHRDNSGIMSFLLGKPYFSVE